MALADAENVIGGPPRRSFQCPEDHHEETCVLPVAFGVQLRGEISLVDHKGPAKELEGQRQQEVGVGWIARLNYVEATFEVGHGGQPTRREQRISVLVHVGQPPR